ncbi:MAG: metalloprotease [Bacteroidetes bacterium]|nr:MAG: metalloprotease [Bacteroidota bacterium]
MRWKGRQGSSNVEYRRGSGGGGGFRRNGTRIGLGTLVIFVVVLLLGGDPMQFLQQVQQSPAGYEQPAPGQSAPNSELEQFVAVVLKDTEDVWDKLFQEQLNQRYRHPVLIVFEGQTRSACGFASAATGPFYCPADDKLYIDLSFYQQLKTRFGAPGDFAMAYVIAHEVGHHVQHLLGITDQVHAQRRRISEAEYNALSVRLELQADFLAGVWAHHAQRMKNILEQGDIEEAMQAAQAIGDDRLQMEAQGYVVPESFTHGTSAQRLRWFRKGLETGDLSQGDTFKARNL